MKKRLTILVAGLMVLLILAAPVAAGAIKTEYEGFEYYVGPVSDGKQWVTPGGVLQVRGMEEAYRDEVTDPRLSGDTLVTINCSFHFAEDPAVMFYGPMWGTFVIENGAGTWEGTWVGKRTQAEGYSYISGVLRGHGAYEGLQARVDYVRESPDPAAPFAVHGVLMDPGG